MKEIKFLINKYSFIASLGVILAFFISFIGAIALKDISMNLVFSCIAFLVLFYIKGIVKNKFDILRYPNNYYNIGETFCLSVVFLLLPTISIVLGLIKEELEVSSFTLLTKCIVVVISMSILFTFYNGSPIFSI